MDIEKIEKELDFENTKDKIVKFLEAHHAIVLATALDKRVTIRTVTYATKGLEVYFMSFGHHKKIKQIEKNSRVALCKDNVNIEGVAEILGSPLDETNRKYAEIYKKKLPRDYAGFAHIPGMVMVKVTPKFIVSMVRIEKRLYLEHLDLGNKRAYLKKLQDETH
jgi:general stress protein 26